MSTIAAALQIPTPTPAVDAALATPKINATTGAATARASEDFVMALTQALNAVAPPVAAAQAQLASVVVPNTLTGEITTEITIEDEPSAAELAASFAGLLSFPLPAQVTAPVPADPLELLGVNAGARRDASGPQLLLEAALSAAPSLGSGIASALDEQQLEVPDQLAVPDQSNPNLLLAPAGEKLRHAPGLTPDAVVSRPLHSSVGTQAWSEELSTRVTMLAERGQQSASLRLSPEHLGPLEIRIAIRDDQASVWFGAVHADTRAAIEHALPRLREMFAAQGMSLTDAGVSREPPREQAAPQRGAAAFDEPATETSVTLTTLQRLGLIDAYA